MPAPSRRRRPPVAVAGSSPLTVAGSASFLRTSQLSRNIRAPETVALVAAGHLARRGWFLAEGWRAISRLFSGASRRLRTVPPAYIRLFYPTCTAASRGLRALGISESDFFLKPFRNTSAPCIWFPLKNLLRTAMIAPQKAWRRVPPDRASFPHPLVISYIRRAPLSSFSERHGKKISIGKWGGKGPSSGRSKAGCRLRGIMGDPESGAGRGKGGAGEISV